MAITSKPVNTSKPVSTNPLAACKTKEDVLSLVSQGKATVEQASRWFADKAREGKGLRCKVSAKGALSVYNLQRLPVTLYAGQWERLLDFAQEITTFIAEHADALARKDAA